MVVYGLQLSETKDLGEKNLVGGHQMQVTQEKFATFS